MAKTSEKTVKISAIVMFSILVLGGAIMLVVSCSLESETHSAHKYLDDSYRVPEIVAIVGAICLIIGASFSLFGSVQLRMWLLSGGTSLVFVAFVWAVIEGFFAIYNLQRSDYLDWDELQNNMENYYEYQHSVDKIQREYHCCGYESPIILDVPDCKNAVELAVTCCRGDVRDCHMMHKERFKTACKPALKSYLKNVSLTYLFSALLLGALELIAVIIGVLFIYTFWYDND